MNRFREMFTTWFYSNPRRWAWVGLLLVVIAILAVTGNLR
jgi:hypothetical protein